MLSSGIDGGGVGKIIYTYVKYIDRTRFNVDVASLNSENGNVPFYYEDFKKICNNVYLLDKKNYFKRFGQWRSILKSKKYDIVHVHLEEASSLYLLLALIYKVPVRIAHCHITTIPDLFSFKGFKRLLLPLLYCVTTHKYSCGIEAGKRLWGKRDFVVMTNAIECEKFRFNQETRTLIREKLGIEDNVFVLGTVGRLHTQKNPFFIVDILGSLYKQNHKVQLIWAGDGPMRSEIEDVISAKGLSDNVHLLGNRPDIGSLLMAMDVFILPSLYEGLPIVGVEAQASGIPCLFSDKITDEIRLSDNCIFLPINNPHEWAIYIGKMKRHTDQRVDEKISSTIYNISNAVKKLQNEYISYVV